MVEVLEGIVILAVAVSVPEVRAAAARQRPRHSLAQLASTPSGRDAMKTTLLLLLQTLRIAIPYLFAASGGVLAERAGIVSLTLEGFMLSGAFCATLGSFYFGSPVDRACCSAYSAVPSSAHCTPWRRSGSRPTRS